MGTPRGTAGQPSCGTEKAEAAAPAPCSGLKKRIFSGKSRSLPAVRGGMTFRMNALHASSFSICAGFSAAFTLSKALAMMPFSSIRYVVRTTPMETLPQVFFSFQTS